jgi:hypothetical protein
MEMLHRVFTKLPFKISYTSYARLDLIWKFPEMRELLLESGAKSLAFGIETLNEVAGKKIGKGLGEKRVKDTLNYCAETWKGNIITSSNFIVGLPGEDEASINRTVDYLTSNDCPLDVFGFLPLYIRSEHDGRGTSKIDQNPNKFGYIIEDGNQWQNTSMSFKDASMLVYRVMTDPRVNQKSKFHAATWIGRVINLGYSVEDIFNIMQDPNLNHTIINNRLLTESAILKNRYREQLMMI